MIETPMITDDDRTLEATRQRHRRLLTGVPAHVLTRIELHPDPAPLAGPGEAERRFREIADNALVTPTVTEFLETRIRLQCVQDCRKAMNFVAGPLPQLDELVALVGTSRTMPEIFDIEHAAQNGVWVFFSAALIADLIAGHVHPSLRPAA